MSHTVILIKGKRGWEYHTIHNRSNNILEVSKPHWFKKNAEKEARKKAIQLKAKYVPYERLKEVFKEDI